MWETQAGGDVTQTANRAEEFYASALKSLVGTGVPFLIGGAYAMRAYADIYRETKDLDIFCKASDYPVMLDALREAGYEIELTDAEWLAKARCGEHFVDIIFSSRNGMCVVDDTWFEHARDETILDVEVKLIPAEEEIWTKVYVQDRHRYDGADVLHIIRKMGNDLDWHRLLLRLELHWELLLQHLVLFRFVYPSDSDKVPAWLMQELLGRMQRQESVPASQDPVCRGPLLSASQYIPDIQEWSYKSRY
jgi:hypothetical protein